VKISTVAPDHRNVPATAGVMLKNAGLSRTGTCPRAAIGSEKTTRISFASSIDATSPAGPALTTRRGARGCATATIGMRKRRRRTADGGS
jgi:hypothetical protein